MFAKKHEPSQKFTVGKRWREEEDDVGFFELAGNYGGAGRAIVAAESIVSNLKSLYG
jgi:hypothetical protein